MKKFGRVTRVLFVLLCIVLFGGFILSGEELAIFKSLPVIKQSDDSRTPQEMQRDFDTFINSVFAEEVSDDSITLNYSLKDKQKYGLAGLEPTLGEVSIDDMKSSLFVSENRLASLETFSYDKLSKEQQIIYDIIYNMYNQNMESADKIGRAHV